MRTLLYAGFGEIGIRGLSNIFSCVSYSTENITVLIDESNNDILIKEFCKKYNLSTIKEEEINNVKKTPFDLCLSVHWRKKIRNNILSKCKHGGINLHPSLLPKYAGCSSLAWAILNNENYAGYSWHQITDNFDEGDIFFQKSIKISKKDTAYSLWNKVNNNAIDGIIDIIEMILSKKTKAIKQDLSKRSYFSRGFPTFEEALKINKDLDKDTYLRAKYFPGKFINKKTQEEH